MYKNNIHNHYSTSVPPHKTYKNFLKTQLGCLLPLRFASRRSYCLSAIGKIFHKAANAAGMAYFYLPHP